MIDTGLHDSVVLVTGANSGIGAAIARAFGAEGAAVVVHYLGSEQVPVPGVEFHHETPGQEAAESVAAELKANGGASIAVAADLSDPAAIARLLDAGSSLGPIRVLVNNAAHCEMPDDILNITAEGIDRHFAVNTRAPVLLMREFARRLQHHPTLGGRIINISTDAVRAFATQVAYGASKAALEAFTRSAATELGPSGITVNAIAPGPVQTGWISPDLEQSVISAIPLRRVGTPKDIADAAVFLASDQASWITGQVIQVAGGHAL